MLWAHAKIACHGKGEKTIVKGEPPTGGGKRAKPYQMR